MPYFRSLRTGLSLLLVAASASLAQAQQPAAPTGVKTQLGLKEFRMHWTSVPKVDAYNIYRSSKSGKYKDEPLGSVATPGYVDKALTLGKTYYYVIRSKNIHGLSNPSQEVHFTYAKVLDAPTWVSAVSHDGSIDLTWKPVEGALGYKVFFLKGPTGVFTTFPRFNVTGTSLTDPNLENGKRYRYYVTAYNERGLGIQSSLIEASPIGAPTALKAVSSNQQVSLSWTAPVGATSFEVLRSRKSGDFSKAVTLSATETQFTDTGLDDGVAYFYKVRALNASGSGSLSEQASATTVGVPRNVKAEPSDHMVLLRWKLSAGATAYGVRRSETAGGPYILLDKSVKTGTFWDKKIEDGKDYYYRVYAFNSTGQSADSAETSAYGYFTPKAPTDLRITTDAKTANFSFTPTPHAFYYILSRSRTPGGPYTEVKTFYKTTPVSVTVPAGQLWYYVLRSTSYGGRSPYSNEVSGATGVFGPPQNVTAIAENAKVRLSWTVGGLQVAYNVKRSLSFDGPFETIASGVTGTGYIDTKLKNGTTYYYVITALNAAKEESLPSAVVGGTPGTKLGAPTSLTAIASDQSVTLGWRLASQAVKYNVKRSESATGPFTTVGSAVASPYTDNGLTDGTTYYYVVSSVGGNGKESADSNVVSAEPTGIPAAPAIRSVVPGTNRVKLSWDAVPGADSASTGTTYTVQASRFPSDDFVTLAENLTTTEYLHVVNSNNITFYYRVFAVNHAGAGPVADGIAFGTPLPQPVSSPPLSDYDAVGLTIFWNEVPGATSYLIQRAKSSDGVFRTFASADGTGITATRLHDDGTLLFETGPNEAAALATLEAHQNYTYRVIPINVSNNGRGDYLTVTAAAGPSRPTEIQDLQGSYENGVIHLSWKPDAQTDLCYVFVEINGISQGFVHGATGLDFDDIDASGATPGDVWTFHVTPTNSGTTGPTSVVSVTIPSVAALKKKAAATSGHAG